MRTVVATLLAFTALVVTPGSAGAADTVCATPGIAHRGIVTRYTENTVGSVDAAIAEQAPFEVDLRSTRDDAVVLMHDRTVDRTTDGVGYVRRLTAKKISTFHTNDGQRVPTANRIMRILAANPEARAHLELKALSSTAMQTLASRIRQYGVGPQIVIESLRAAQLDSFHSLMPEIPAYLIRADLPDPATLTYNVAVYPTYITQAWVDDMRARGLVFRGRLADRPESWDAGLTYGVTGFVTGDLQKYRDYCSRWTRTTAP